MRAIVGLVSSLRSFRNLTNGMLVKRQTANNFRLYTASAHACDVGNRAFTGRVTQSERPVPFVAFCQERKGERRTISEFSATKPTRARSAQLPRGSETEPTKGGCSSTRRRPWRRAAALRKKRRGPGRACRLNWRAGAPQLCYKRCCCIGHIGSETPEVLLRV